MPLFHNVTVDKQLLYPSLPWKPKQQRSWNGGSKSNFWASTLGKLFTHACLSHQAV